MNENERLNENGRMNAVKRQNDAYGFKQMNGMGDESRRWSMKVIFLALAILVIDIYTFIGLRSPNTPFYIIPTVFSAWVLFLFSTKKVGESKECRVPAVWSVYILRFAIAASVCILIIAFILSLAFQKIFYAQYWDGYNAWEFIFLMLREYKYIWLFKNFLWISGILYLGWVYIFDKVNLLLSERILHPDNARKMYRDAGRAYMIIVVAMIIYMVFRFCTLTTLIARENLNTGISAVKAGRVIERTFHNYYVLMLIKMVLFMGLYVNAAKDKLVDIDNPPNL